MSKIKDITPAEALSLTRKGVLLVDVREPQELARKSFDLPGVMGVPLSKIESRFQDIPQGKQVIIACQRGNRSMVACNFLQGKGYRKLVNLQGGITRWEREGMPVKGAPKQSLLSLLLKKFGKQS